MAGYFEQLSAAVARMCNVRTVTCHEVLMVHLAVVPFRLVLEHGADIAHAVKTYSE